jgi:hemolysin D
VIAVAQGKIVPNDRSKVVQPLEAAVVRAIHVSDGQSVEAGQLLMELDATLTTADRDRTQQDWHAASLQVARAQAMLQAIASSAPVALARPPRVDDTRYQESLRQVQGQYAEYLARISRIDADINRRAAEVRSTQEAIRKLEQTVPIARQRAQDYQQLVSQNFMSQHGYLEKEQARIEQEADLATQRSRLQEIQAGLLEAQGQLRQATAEARRASLDSLAEGQQKAASLAQELLKAESRHGLMRITAPVAGSVQQLAIHTVGGVVTPAQPLMVVVPSGDDLEIEAFLENKDIGFVKAGQKAEIKVETFPYTKYGTLPGLVTSVSHDAINDPDRGLIYAIRVKLATPFVTVADTAIRLTPGMSVSVEVKTGQRRLIEYLLTPLLETTGESFRER